MVRKLRCWAGITLMLAVYSHALPPTGYHKVAYYTFDATPVGQGVRSLTDFTDNANVVVVFEGTLWELADTANYTTGWMQNKIYTSKKQIIDDIHTLQDRGLLVLMNVDDAASWSTETPFTTWDGKKYDYRQFAAFVDSCAGVVGFDGIALDVEHKAVDNTHYRNLIKEFGKYFGPLSSDSATTIYTAAVYYGKYGAPGPIFRDKELYRPLNFLMEMGYTRDNMERFQYWAESAGNSKVMVGMSHQDNALADAVDWAKWHPDPEKAGVMVYAANVNKEYTDSIFSALGDEKVGVVARKDIHTGPIYTKHAHDKIDFHFSTVEGSRVSLDIISPHGRVCRHLLRTRVYSAGIQTVIRDVIDDGTGTSVSGIYYVVFTVNGHSQVLPFVAF